MEKRVMVVLGTRPEIIKLAPVIFAFRRRGLEGLLLTVDTGQHPDLMQEFYEMFGITPDITFSLDRSEGGLSQLLAQTMMNLGKVLESHPTLEYVLAQGDTNSVLAASTVSFLEQKKFIHVEAGLRTGDLEGPFPEEYNRKVASLTASMHFAPHKQARENLLSEGVDASRIRVVGNTLIDTWEWIGEQFDMPVKASSARKVLITLHRRENQGEPLNRFKAAILNLAEKYPELEFTWINHPNTNALSDWESAASIPNLSVLAPMSMRSLAEIYRNCALVITDSGGVQEEATWWGIPMVVFREKTEREEPFQDNYPVVLTNDPNALEPAVAYLINTSPGRRSYYGDGRAAQRIVDWFEEEVLSIPVYGTAIIGGGPAGTGLIMKSMKDGNLESFLNAGIALIEGSGELMVGGLSKYELNSDTHSGVFLECLDGETEHYLDMKQLQPMIDRVKRFAGGPIPLGEAGKFLGVLGEHLERILDQNQYSNVFKHTRVDKIIRDEKGYFRLVDNKGCLLLKAEQIVSATGGQQVRKIALQEEIAPGVLLKPFAEKVLLSDDVLCGFLDHELGVKLSEGKPNRVVILGSSHSAFSVAWYLLQHWGALFKEAEIVILGRRSPQIYFADPEEARSMGYDNFTTEDLCTKTGRLHRLGGLRMDGRQLAMEMAGLGDVPNEKRAVFKELPSSPSEVLSLLESADHIVAALGYTSNQIPLFEANGNRIPLPSGLGAKMVDDTCRLLDASGNAIPNAYGVGMASGFVPSGELGGEPNFKGQTNGLWYYQNLVAELILNQIKHAHSANLS